MICRMPAGSVVQPSLCQAGEGPAHLVSKAAWWRWSKLQQAPLMLAACRQTEVLSSRSWAPPSFRGSPAGTGRAQLHTSSARISAATEDRRDADIVKADLRSASKLHVCKSEA